MWNKPTKKQLDKIPRLYVTEDTPLKEKIVQMHFFILECDWFITEFDGEDIFFGYALLNGDQQNAEWGYISLKELQELSIKGIEIDREIHWKPKPAREIEKISKL
ncbi:DUF2958 domain-containing protein [Thermodesulfobacteriota bacterium]